MNIYLKKEKNIIDSIENHLPTARTLESSSRQKLLQALATVCPFPLSRNGQTPGPVAQTVGWGLCSTRASLCSLLTSLCLKNSKDVPCCWAVSSMPWRRWGGLPPLWGMLLRRSAWVWGKLCAQREVVVSRMTVVGAGCACQAACGACEGVPDSPTPGSEQAASPLPS